MLFRSQRVWNLASSKADNTSFLALQKKVESNNTNITTNYLTKEDATNTYVNKSFLEGTTETTAIRKLFPQSN